MLGSRCPSAWSHDEDLGSCVLLTRGFADWTEAAQRCRSVEHDAGSVMTCGGLYPSCDAFSKLLMHGKAILLSVQRKFSRHAGLLRVRDSKQAIAVVTTFYARGTLKVGDLPQQLWTDYRLTNSSSGAERVIDSRGRQVRAQGSREQSTRTLCTHRCAVTNLEFASHLRLETFTGSQSSACSVLPCCKDKGRCRVFGISNIFSCPCEVHLLFVALVSFCRRRSTTNPRDRFFDGNKKNPKLVFFQVLNCSGCALLAPALRRRGLREACVVLGVTSTRVGSAVRSDVTWHLLPCDRQSRFVCHVDGEWF